MVILRNGSPMHHWSHVYNHSFSTQSFQRKCNIKAHINQNLMSLVISWIAAITRSFVQSFSRLTERHSCTFFWKHPRYCSWILNWWLLSILTKKEDLLAIVILQLQPSSWDSLLGPTYNLCWCHTRPQQTKGLWLIHVASSSRAA